MERKNNYIDMEPYELVEMADCLIAYFTEHPSEIGGKSWLEKMLNKARTLSAKDTRSTINSKFRAKLEEFNRIYRCARC